MKWSDSVRFSGFLSCHASLVVEKCKWQEPARNLRTSHRPRKRKSATFLLVIYLLKDGLFLMKVFMRICTFNESSQLFVYIGQVLPDLL